MEKRQIKYTRRYLGAKPAGLCSLVCLGLSMGQCVFSSSACREDDKALCAVPTPRKLLAALLFPSLLPLPSSQQCTIDSSFQLSAKASRNWIMKWSCGKKKLKQRGSFYAKQPKTLPSFTSSGTRRSQNTSPLQLPPAHPWPKSAHLHCPPPKSGSLHATTIPPRIRALRAASSRKTVRVGHRLKGLLLSPAVLQLPGKKFMQTPNNA